ncbi:biopolymer transporter ExbD [Roseovarius sp. EL26]|uniref:ExbD/TolR family protein n=1 Tax=Roseovarius sp. EL26 TaxID=2126672 RepID=UPI000EA27EA8|nr:biopolymer transporter ExbD [Roseovarius sp. EL26]
MIKQHRKPTREPTIALINIVFLMLVFFMVAGTLSQPLNKDLKLAQTDELDGRAPPDTLVVHSDGRMMYRGKVVENAAAFLALKDIEGNEERPTVRIVPDRELNSHVLLTLAKDLRQAGAQRIVLVTERGLQ